MSSKTDDEIPLDKSSLPPPEITCPVSDIDEPSPTPARASRPHSQAFSLSERVPPSSKDSKIETPLADQKSLTIQTLISTTPSALTHPPTQANAIAVWPELFGQHRAAGAYAKDSDTGNAGKEAGSRQTGETWKIAESAAGRMEKEFGRWGVKDVDWDTAMQKGR
ncbi:MAG: hypothetical protein Q9221_003283 [Calogaya cf. arnoldii]